MATHKSAEKRHRQNLKKNEHNRFAKATFRTAMKNALTSAQAGKKEEAKEQARAATKLLDKAAVHGVLHKKTAQRKISRLNSAVNKLTASA